MWEAINSFLTTVDNLVWGVPLMVLIMAGGILLTARLGLLQMRRLPLALKWMFKNEEEGDGEISSFAALCTALSATIGTGNIVGVATAVCAGGPGALFWMILAAFFGMSCATLVPSIPAPPDRRRPAGTVPAPNELKTRAKEAPRGVRRHD